MVVQWQGLGLTSICLVSKSCSLQHSLLAAVRGQLLFLLRSPAHVTDGRFVQGWPGAYHFLISRAPSHLDLEEVSPAEIWIWEQSMHGHSAFPLTIFGMDCLLQSDKSEEKCSANWDVENTLLLPNTPRDPWSQCVSVSINPKLLGSLPRVSLLHSKCLSMVQW